MKNHMRVRPAIWLAVLTVGAALMLVLAIRTAVPTDQPPLEVDPRPPKSSLFNVPSLSLPPQAGRPPLGPTAWLAHQMAKASDLRVFAEMAKQKPELGGYAYAQTAALMCGMRDQPAMRNAAMLAPLSNKPNVQQRMEAYKRFERRCASFTQEELTNGYSIDFMREARQRGDVVIRAHYDWGERFEASARSPSAAQAIVEEVLAMRDPLSIDLLQTFSTITTKDGQNKAYLDGQLYGGVSKQDFHYAWMLTGCAFSSCDIDNNSDVLLTCLKTGHCVQDRHALLEWEMSRTTGRFERIMQVHRRLVAAIDNKELAALMPPQAAYAEQVTDRSQKPLAGVDWPTAESAQARPN